MKRAYSILGALLLAVTAGLVLVLANQNRQLQRRVEFFRDRATGPYAGFLVPTIETTTFEGQPVALGAPRSGSRQLLLAFTTTCPYCRASLPAWKQLTARLAPVDSPKVEVYGLALDSADQSKRYIAQHQLSFPIVDLTDRKAGRLYRVSQVPLILILDSGGQVVYTRTGVLNRQSQIDSVLEAARAPVGRPRPSAVMKRISASAVDASVTAR